MRRKFKSRRRGKRLYKRPTKVAFAKGNTRTTKSRRIFLRHLNATAERKIYYNAQDAAGTPLPNIALRGTGVLFNGEAPPDGANSLTNFCPVVGTLSSQRIGDKIFVRYVTWTGYIVVPLSSGYSHASCIVRLMILWPRRMGYAVGDCPSGAIFQDVDKDKWIMMKQKFFKFGNQTTGIMANTHMFRFKIKVMRTVNFEGGAPVQTLPRLFAVTNIAADQVPNPSIAFTCRYTFTDV